MYLKCCRFWAIEAAGQGANKCAILQQNTMIFVDNKQRERYYMDKIRAGAQVETGGSDGSKRPDSQGGRARGSGISTGR